jgi:succinoglycan biosynthesis protein ExoM
MLNQTMSYGVSAPLMPEAVGKVTVPHICACVCTYKRPEMLGRLLAALAEQKTEGQFTFSVVVVDNDRSRSAEATVSKFKDELLLAIDYFVEPRQSIALARNKAIENARGDFIALIDDDEFPEANWLHELLKACNEHQVSGVLGPVKRYFDAKPPDWILKGKFYDRPTGRTGTIVEWKSARTGNVLLRKQVFVEGQRPFRPEFRAGEDQDFFRRMIDIGHSFVWCNNAIAYEVVPEMRWKRRFMLKQALLRGATARQQPLGIRDIAKSIIAVPAYAILLPVALVCGQHWFMTFLVKLCDHAGKLVALAGINPIKEPYITE